MLHDVVKKILLVKVTVGNGMLWKWWKISKKKVAENLASIDLACFVVNC